MIIKCTTHIHLLIGEISNTKQFVNQIFRSTAGQAMFNILKRNHYNPSRYYDELRIKVSFQYWWVA